VQTHEIRQRFLDYFTNTGHTLVPSASLILDDPNLLFIGAGMMQFVSYFLEQPPAPYPRATSVQKCVRTGDIENVGVTTRHNTFFQMAGNFSFGDYFKREAISHAWALLTSSVADGGYGMDPDRIWVTVYLDDDEAITLWEEIAGLPAERIQRRGMADNYWSMGIPGPCGPCSEIYYDRGPAYGIGGGPEADEDRYIEIWNLVFMQNQRGEGTGKGNFEILGPLPEQNIDTGLGIERVAFLLQGVDNVYETDLVRPVITKAEELSGRRYGAGNDVEDVRFRVIADHARTAVMLIADGVTPGNDGRGYVLRRLLRRIVRSARLLGVPSPSMASFVAVVRETMSESYPELTTDAARIERIAVGEETAFLQTLTSGSKLFDNAVEQVRAAGNTMIGGDQAFALHDTYGFPIDLTLEMAAEAGITVDEPGFRALMAQQRQRAKSDAASRKHAHSDLSVYRELLEAGPTEFTGYTELSSEATVLGILNDSGRSRTAGEGEVVEVVLDRSPLYAESGGQDSDAGVITGDGVQLEVLDVQKVAKRLWVHRVRVGSGELTEGANVLAQVDPEWRAGARQGHSGTHLVHAALREVLGPTALQNGSYNKPGYLRLDFAWQGGLSAETRSEVEEVTNRAVRGDLPVRVLHTDMAGARELGALALFGETYDSEVRVVEIGGPWSRELCGGTHVLHSSQVGPVTLLGESSVGSGTRRIEAYVGLDAYRYLAKERALMQGLATTLKVPDEEVPARVADLLERLRVAERELEQTRAAAVLSAAATLVESAERIGEVLLVATAAPDGVDGADLRALAGDVRGKLGQQPGVVALFSATAGKVTFIVATTAAARDRDIAAGGLVPSFAAAVGGRGGGKPDMAQGGGTDPAGIPAALAALRAHLEQL